MTGAITFDVVGVPKPQGSKKAFVVNGKARLTESSNGHADWRNQVADKAREQAEIHGQLTGPLSVRCQFLFDMPASRSKAQRTAGMIPKTTAPDTDKLLRCVFDALQVGGLIKNDAQIALVHASKHEVNAGWSGVSITLSGLTS